MVPERLVVNVVLPGVGRVDLRGLRLVQYEHGSMVGALSGGAGAWWGPKAGGVIGGLIGTVLGLGCAFMAFLIHRSVAPGFVRALLVAMHIAGDIAFVVGLVAMLGGQPYVVYYPLLLTGILSAILALVMLRRSTAINAQRELRRIQAADAS